jgi:DNA mismatch endonuclease (patch repair protein)
MMSAIRGKNTDPELRVRRHLHQSGLRYRLHDPRLPGRPDIVLPRYHTAIQVNGCFWHRHDGCEFAYTPSSNRRFWKKKFSENVERDKRSARRLHELGWRLIVVWECEASNSRRLDRIVRRIRSAGR